MVAGCLYTQVATDTSSIIDESKLVEGKSSEDETGVFTGGEELSDEEMQNMLTEVVRLGHGYKYVDNSGNEWKWTVGGRLFIPLEKWNTLHSHGKLLPSIKEFTSSEEFTSRKDLTIISKPTIDYSKCE